MKFSTLRLICLVAMIPNGLYAQLPNYVPSNGLIAWYPLDADTKDYSGNNLDGANNNTVKSTDRYGQQNAAYYFDGKAEILNKNYPTNLKAYTYSCWVKADSPFVSDGNIIVQSGKRNSIEFACFGLDLRSNTFNARHRQADESLNSASLSNSIGTQWYHLANTWDGDSTRLYVNGVLVNTVLNNSSTQFLSNFRIGNGVAGSSGFTYAFKGKVDEVGVWKRALSEKEVHGLFLGCNPNFSIMQQPSDTSQHTGTTAFFSANTSDTTANYQWQTNAAGAGWVALSNTNQYSGVNQANLAIQDIQVYNHLQRFRVLINYGTCSDTSQEALLTVVDTCVNLVNDTAYYGVTDTLYIDAVLTSGSNPNVNTLRVYPNPAKDYLIINTGDYTNMSGYSIQIENNLGQVVFDELLNSQQFTLNLSDWTGKGLYVLSLIDKSSRVVETRILLMN